MDMGGSKHSVYLLGHLDQTLKVIENFPLQVEIMKFCFSVSQKGWEVCFIFIRM